MSSSTNGIELIAAATPQFHRVITFDDLVIENGDIVIKFDDSFGRGFYITGLSHNHNALCSSGLVVQETSVSCYCGATDYQYVTAMTDDVRFNNLVNTVRALPPKYQDFLFKTLDMLVKLKDK